jgi:putative PIN family toxin of toxin-antitoxin system
MRVVIDTNILISAVLKDRDPEAVIMFVAEHEDIDWIVSQAIISEYREVLSRPKFGLTTDLLHKWFAVLNSLTVTWVVDLEIEFPRDKKDAKFITCALVAGADYFITGDRDFSEATKLLSTTILSVSQFKNLVCARMVAVGRAPL